jgi:predicted transcriptional regulator
MSISFTDREADIMKVLWQRGPSTVAEVRESLDDELAYTTVLSILRTLEQKEYVSHEEEGRTHRFYATVDQQTARQSALQHLTGKLFEGSSELLLTQLVSDRNLSKAQVDRIKKLLQQHTWKGKS